MFKKIECIVIESAAKMRSNKKNVAWKPNDPPPCEDSDPSPISPRFRVYNPARGVKSGILFDVNA